MAALGDKNRSLIPSFSRLEHSLWPSNTQERGNSAVVNKNKQTNEPNLQRQQASRDLFESLAQDVQQRVHVVKE